MLAKAGVGVDSWKPADFPNRLPADPAPDAASQFTPNPAQPVYVVDQKVQSPPQPAVIPDLKAQAEEIETGECHVRSNPGRGGRSEDWLVFRPDAPMAPSLAGLG